jgi:4-aminobutyrate aminotransferase/(S)-3-amino-2-methylpropionate transaminase
MLTGKELAQVGNAPGKKTKELMEWGAKYCARGVNTGKPVFIDEGKGAVVKDLDGNTYIDFFGGIGVVNAGHCPEPVVEAIKKQAERFLHTFHTIIPHEHYVKLAKKLCEIVPADFPKKAMFVNSGAECVENAVKIARKYTGKTGIISFESAFHGRTLLAMSLTSKVRPYKFGFGPFAPEVYKVPSAYCYRCPWNSTYPGCGMHCLEHFHTFFKAEVDPETVACLIIEPVQGEGGFIVPPKEYLPGLKQICAENGIVFIADEVQTGFCRTGKMFACENFGVEPDLITMAKSIATGMPLSAVVGKAEIMDAPEGGQIGGTFSGNGVSCAAALAAIEIYETEKLADRANKINEFVVEKLKLMQEKHAQIGDIRHLGAMIAFELVKDPKTKEPAKDEANQILGECFKRGLLIIGAGVLGNTIRMLMPLVITDEQLAQAMDILEESVDIVLS